LVDACWTFYQHVVTEGQLATFIVSATAHWPRTAT
jgi:hypothetical protein